MIVGARVVYDSDIENMDSVTELEPNPNIFGEYEIATTIYPLNLRQNPDTDASIIVPMSKGRTFTCYGFTDTTGDWYLGEFVSKGKVYAGFAHKNYLKRKES